MKHLTRREEWEQILGIWNLYYIHEDKTGKIGIYGHVLTGNRGPLPGFTVVQHPTSTRPKGYWTEYKFCNVPINDINGACLDEDQFEKLIEDMEIVQLLE